MRVDAVLWRLSLYGVLLLSVALSACAPARLLERAAPGIPRHAELDRTPFFAQRIHQCGPAALAMLFGAQGKAVDPDALAADMYRPELQGSLQSDLLAVARRRGWLPYVIGPSLTALLQEMSAGHPVLVLQSLDDHGRSTWHYAVAIGYDLGRDELVLRSGQEPRVKLEARAFDQSWQPGHRWGVVLLKPGQLPATASLPDYLKAVLAAEPYLTSPDRQRALDVALVRWPEAADALFVEAQARLARADSSGARRLLVNILQGQPRHMATLHALAALELEYGCASDARRLLDRASANPEAAAWSDETARLRAAAQAGAAAVCRPDGY